MNVQINGMEMPKNCYECRLKQINGIEIVCPILNERFFIVDIDILYRRLDNCPLGPVSSNDAIEELNKRIDFLMNCIYEAEDALNRGTDNEWARAALEKADLSKEE